MDLKEFLKPTKRKFLWIIGFVVVWKIYILLKYFTISSLLFSDVYLQVRWVSDGILVSLYTSRVDYVDFIGFTVSGMLLNILLYYPFMCSVTAIYDARKNRAIEAVLGVKKVLFALIFLNPISLNVFVILILSAIL